MNINGFTLYEIFIVFVVYSFLGWCLEVIYAAVKQKKFINRGFLYGPFCPIYGVGTVCIVVLLEPVKTNFTLLFLCSVLVTGLLEYLTGFALEKVFHSTWWDYSEEKINIKGRVCLKFSVIWGVISVIVVKIINPFINPVVVKVTPYTNFVHLVFLYFWTDFTFTIISLYGFRQLIIIMENLKAKHEEEIKNLYQFRSDAKVEIDRLRTEFKAKEEFLYNRITKKYKHIFEAFPRIKSKRHNIIQEIKNRLK